MRTGMLMLSRHCHAVHKVPGRSVTTRSSHLVERVPVMHWVAMLRRLAPSSHLSLGRLVSHTSYTSHLGSNSSLRLKMLCHPIPMAKIKAAEMGPVGGHIWPSTMFFLVHHGVSKSNRIFDFVDFGLILNYI